MPDADLQRMRRARARKRALLARLRRACGARGATCEETLAVAAALLRARGDDLAALRHAPPAGLD